MLVPLAMSMIELDCNVKAPMPAVLFVTPCSWRPPVLNVPPFRVIVALLLIRSVLAALVCASSNVPPELIVIPLVLANLGVPEEKKELLSNMSVPPLIVVVPP